MENHLELNLKETAKKIYKTGFFSNLTIKGSILHFEYGNWQFNCYQSGKVTATLPEEYEEMGLTYESEYQSLGMIKKVRWLDHEEIPTDNPEFCKRFALSYVYNTFPCILQVKLSKCKDDPENIRGRSLKCT